MHRFYCPHTDFSSPEVVIADKKERHHLLNVLRLKKGDTIELFNEKAEEAVGCIFSINPSEIRVRIQSVSSSVRRAPLIVLACAIPKKTKFEWIIEKAAELGVDEIVPLRTARTEVKLAKEQAARKMERYQTVAVNAAKQSQRPEVPAIGPVTDFSSALERLSRESLVFIPSLQGKRENILKAFERHPSPREISFLIGPEGDFTPEEYDLAGEKGCIPVSLGETILKVETAAIASVACAHFYYRHV